MEAKAKSKNRNAGPWHVAVVDDNPSIHAAVREHFQGACELWQVIAYHNGAEAINGLAAAPPDVVLMDIGMPEMSGIECAHQLKRQFRDLPIIMHTARAQAEMVMSALRAGARGYVVKKCPLTDLTPLLDKAIAGGLALCPMAERLLLDAMHRAPLAPTEWGLTQREEDVLLCLCRHLSNKEMATALGLSERTVNVHLSCIFKKLDVHDRKTAMIARPPSQNFYRQTEEVATPVSTPIHQSL